MHEKTYSLVGFLGPPIAYISVAISIAFSPDFSWRTSALSDLGHAAKSQVASVFNLGLIIAGFLMVVYGVTVFKMYAKYTSIVLAMSACLSNL
ncbi:DUF998 domain-containing protein [Candidatus Bathyarchaeota archaeon]|nr:DUF998 domain-containing protein [Candidatus Bathyarchaeota archaeon]